MGHIPLGYIIKDGVAVINKTEADKVRLLYKYYLSGLSLTAAAKEAGIETYHGTAKRILENRRYLGDDFYPAIIDENTYYKAQEELLKRATRLGRLDKAAPFKPITIPTGFTIGTIKERFDDPIKQAEYLYSLIESEVS